MFLTPFHSWLSAAVVAHPWPPVRRDMYLQHHCIASLFACLAARLRATQWPARVLSVGPLVCDTF